MYLCFNLHISNALVIQIYNIYLYACIKNHTDIWNKRENGEENLLFVCVAVQRIQNTRKKTAFKNWKKGDLLCTETAERRGRTQTRPPRETDLRLSPCWQAPHRLWKQSNLNFVDRFFHLSLKVYELRVALKCFHSHFISWHLQILQVSYVPPVP